MHWLAALITILAAYLIGSIPFGFLMAHWRGVNIYYLINAALARLEETRWIRSVVTPLSKSGGRPTIHYEINPEIIRRRNAGDEAKYAKKGGFVRTG